VLLNFRDRRMLGWHFAGPMRAKQLWILTVSRERLMRAYAILKRQDHPPSGLTRMRMVDYQSIDSDDALWPIIGAAIARCWAERIQTLEHVASGLPKMRTFDALAPYRRKLPAWPFYFKATDPGLEIELADPLRWDASSYGGDASM
jgi:hypothetical protein